MKKEDHIIELLEDTSFPQVLLIDGAWGSGKTYFVKNKLMNALTVRFEEEKVEYFSLFGLTSISDFKNRIISLLITGNEGSSVFAKNIAKAIDGVAVNCGERGVGAILSGAAGAYKDKIYSDFDNRIIVLDDLERVPEKVLIRNILGECLNLTESKKVKVIVVSNENKLECKNDIEKVIAHKYFFETTPEEIIEIVKNEFSEIFDLKFLENEVIKIITSIGLKNIRVLKRSIFRFKKIRSEIDKNDNIFKNEAYSIVLNKIIKICYVRFELDYSKEEIIEYSENRLIRYVCEERSDNTKYDVENTERCKNFDEILDVGISKVLIEYCCDGVLKFDDIVTELSLPVRGTLLQSMHTIWSQHELSSEEFRKGIIEIVKHITSRFDLDINEWFFSCDVYIHMLNKQIISSDELSRDDVITYCENIDIASFDKKMCGYRSEKSFYNIEIRKLYNDKYKILEDSIESEKNNKFVADFCKSWSSVSDVAHEKMMHMPFLHNIGVDNLCDALEYWSNDDVFQFLRYITSKYDFSNIEEYFLQERAVMSGSIPKINLLVDKLQTGLKVYSLLELCDDFRKIVERIDNRLDKIQSGISA